MVGHFLLSLTPAQEDNILTRPLGESWSPHVGANNPGCVFQVACARKEGNEYPWDWMQMWRGVGKRYDSLLTRFGEPRVVAAIRNRIWSNRARRELAPASWETQCVGRAS
jgi:hypothetical protein